MNQNFRNSRRVEFRDTDAAGIVHFSVFFAYMEQAEHEFWRSLGTSVVHRKDGETISWPRVNAKCDYLVASKVEQMIDIAVAIVKSGTKSLGFEFTFYRDSEIVAKGQLTTVCCRVGSDRSLTSVEIPDELRTMLEPHVRT